MTLTAKRRVLIEHYLQCWNGAEAARRAGYTHSGANRMASRILNLPEAQALIKERIEALSMSADEAIVRLSEQARADYATYLRADGSVDLERLLADGKGRLIKSLRPGREGLIVEFHDAQAALKLIGRHLALFTDRHEVTGRDGGPLEIRELTDEELADIAAGGGDGAVAP